jgi:8-oxo-dGTP pyrophosphatase MutT (NUDIX family)
VVKTPEGTKREPQLLWDRRGKRFAIAVAIDAHGDYILVEEPKYGQMIRMVSAPTGAIRAGESPLEAAKRELLEETGYVAAHWEESRYHSLVDFADKCDGGEHCIYYAVDAVRQGEPKYSDQKVIIASKDKLIRHLIPTGIVPAISIAALLLPR